MKTIVRNWALITIVDELSPFKVLWAVVVSDNVRNRFKENDYLCSSRILYIEDNLVRTHTGSCYELIGEGSEYVASYAQLISLIDGLSPDVLKLEKK
ncbi:hypothetical protein CJF42_03570 [Pseudoalteromonas sp. NBT06-2]|uniref:hypothetical protein n=1 Tax=Pseudoalteromonas sp. NBT06-2 TaxID=2025950 RepID=UPI000BA68986|nr:hypothetical protein [Pseudoalteromonas sp. NBT06-2]PAJ75722.1 hypothetical protein CJF42_03570 [Pseudoalteromonas sp. NBT06-2]